MISQDTLTRGLRTDDFETSRLDQSSSFVLNGTYDNIDGDSFKVQNEEGNQYVYSAPYTVIGTVNIGRRKTIVFSASVENQSEIGIVENDKYTTLINDTDLRFNTDHPIKGLYKTLNGCETYVYFQDGVNPDRVVNIDNLKEYKNLDDSWNIEKLRLQRVIQMPTVQAVEVYDSGGSLELGKYFFVIEILDKELNTVQKSILSDGVNIYASSFQDTWDSITGNENIRHTLPADGGVPPADKSIKLAFSNLDPDYAYVRLYTIVYNTGDSTTAAVYETGELIPIEGDNYKEYIYRGVNIASDIQSDLAKVTTRDPVWTTSQDMKIVQSRLVRANLRGLADIDYSEFQKSANKVKVEPFVKEARVFQNFNNILENIEFDVCSNLGPTKLGPDNIPLCLTGSGWTYYEYEGKATPEGEWLEKKFYAREKVEGPGKPLGEGWIQEGTYWVRPVNITFVSDTITNDPNPLHKIIYDIDLLVTYGAPIGNSKNAINHSYFQYGEIYALGIVYVFKQGFYSPVFHIPGNENIESIYPDISCNGKHIFGDLTGQPIKHHRFPSPTSLFRVEGEFPNQKVFSRGLGITVSEVEYPHPDITGHYIVYGKRDFINRTVLDTVAYTRISPRGEDITKLDFLNQDYNPSDPFVDEGDPDWFSDQIQIFSPKLLFEKQTMIGKTVETFCYVTTDTQGYDPNQAVSDNWKTIENNDISISGDRFNYAIINSVYVPNTFKLQQTVNVRPKETIAAGSAFYPYAVNNESQYNKFTVAHTSEPVPLIPAYGEDEFVSTTKIRMGLLKQDNPNVHSNLFTIPYVKVQSDLLTNDAPNTIIGGDVYVGPLSFFSIKHTHYTDYNGDPYNIEARQIKNLFFSSEINVAFRHGGTIPSNTIYTGVDPLPPDFILSKFGNITDEGNYQLDPKPIQFYYNNDFSTLNITTFVSLPLSYNYCTDCIGYYPNHIVWSDKQFVESINDEFRTYLNENYTIVGEDKGEISGLYYDGKTLWVHTWESLHALYPNPQQLQTDVNTVYLGTGDFLAIPPSEFSKTDYGYAGSQGRFAHCDTEFGRVYVDGDNGTVFLISQGIQELSSKKFGNQKFLRNNLPLALPKELHPYVATDSIVSGVGIKCTYDPFHKRVFIYKRDYYPINYVGILENLNGGGIIYGNPYLVKNTGLYYSTRYNSFVWIDAKTQDYTFVKLGNPDYFENRSFSISFSFELMAWASFHSWFPSWTFNDAMHIYSCQGKDVWRHDSKTFNTFFNEPHSFIIEFIATAQNFEPSDIDHVDYYAYTRQWVESTKTWSRSIFPTFDKMIVYTDNQSTGELFLTGKQDHFRFFSGFQATVAYATDHYRVNQIYNMAVSNIVFTSDWNSIKGQYFIDKVPIGINPNLSQYYLAPIKSRFWKVRLFYSSSSKIIVDLIRTLHRNRSL